MSKWPKSKLENLVEIRVSNVDKKIYPHKKTVFLCNYMDVYTNDYITKGIPFALGSADINEINRFSLINNDVIITKDSETPEDIAVPSVVIDDIPNLVCGYHLAILRPNKDMIVGSFLMHLLNLPHVQRHFYRRASGSTRYGLTIDGIKSAPINYPHLFTQQKIATILTTLDRAIEKTEDLIAKYQQIKTGLMHDLFTRGIGADGKLRPKREQAPELYKKTEIGWIPREWEVRELGEICEMKSGGTPRRNEPSFWDGDIPWVKTAEIHYNLITDTEEKISKHGLRNSSAKIFPSGTVVMAIYGEGNTRGRVAKLGVDCATNQACVAFFFIDGIVNDYFYYLFEASYNKIRDISNDGSQKNLSTKVLKSFNVCLPANNAEQYNIAKKFKKIDLFIANEMQHRNKLRNQKAGLMNDLLTGKVEVTVDENEAAYV